VIVIEGSDLCEARTAEEESALAALFTPTGESA
jgi:hypothetical protein